MSGRRLVVLGVLVVGLAATGDAQTMPRRDGLWKVQVQMEMPNMPMAIPPMTQEQCITPEDLKDPIRTVPQSGGRGGNPQDCKMTDYQTVGNKITWKMECSGRSPMTGNGEMVYTNDTYTGQMLMNMQGQTMTMKMNGVRLGDCTR